MSKEVSSYFVPLEGCEFTSDFTSEGTGSIETIRVIHDYGRDMSVEVVSDGEHKGKALWLNEQGIEYVRKMVEPPAGRKTVPLPSKPSGLSVLMGEAGHEQPKINKDLLFAIYGTARWAAFAQDYPVLAGLFEAASDTLGFEDEFDSMSDDQAWRAIERLSNKLTSLVNLAIKQLS